jgi:prolipoprotein diacylglyceryltransferase
VILVLLLRLEKGCRFQGELFLDYLALYGVARFLIEYLRDEPFAVFGVFTLGQVACLGIILFALVLRGVLRRRVAA